MDYERAIEEIKGNYPPAQYTLFRRSLDLAIVAIEEKIINDKKAKIYKENGIKYIEIDGKMI